MTNQYNEDLIGVLINLTHNIGKLVEISEQNKELLKNIDWKLWEQLKIAKSTAHHLDIEIFEPNVLDNTKEQ